MPIGPNGRFYPECSKKQNELRQICKQKKFVLANGPRFSGKCLKPDSLVFTPTGLKPIGEFGHSNIDEISPIDDAVIALSPCGTRFIEGKTTGFYNSGFKPAITIFTKSGYELTGSEVHPVWSECQGEIAYRTTAEIKALVADGIAVWLPMMRHTMPNAWPVTKQVCGSTILDEHVAYALGLLVGDGCYSMPVFSNCSLWFSTKDASLIAALQKAFKCFPDFSVSKVPGNNCDYRLRGGSVRKLLKELGMAPKYAYEKSVPHFIFQSPRNVVVAFLQGLFDTDGCVETANVCSFCSSSEELARQVQILMLALGVRSTRKFKPNSKRGGWIITARVEDRFEEKIGFRLARKSAKIKSSGFKFRRSITAYPPSLYDVLADYRSIRKSRFGKLKRKAHRVLDNFFRKNTALSLSKLNPIMAMLGCEHEVDVQRYLIGNMAWWEPVVRCVDTASELVDISVDEAHNFVANGFINHNTMGAYQCIMDHAWETRWGNIAVITLSQSVGIDSGVWKDITETTIPDWISGNFGLQWARRPFIQGVSKKPTLWLTNQYYRPGDDYVSAREYGGITTIQLDSLKNEDEVEGRFKGRRFSMLYVPELSNFHNRSTFDCWTETLRTLGLAEKDHLFLADSNPPDDESWWIYELWWELRETANESMADYIAEHESPLSVVELTTLRDELARIDIMVEDNPYADPKHVILLKAKYSHDEDLYKRYIEGEPTRSTEDSLFHKNFRPSIHVIGERSSTGNKEPEIMVPEPGCHELITSWDPGSSTNSAAVIFEVAKATMTRIGKDEKIITTEVPILKYLDEVIMVDDPHSLDDFTLMVMEKMQFWEQHLGLVGRVNWRHWSDRSVFDCRSPESNRYYHQIVYLTSLGAIRSGEVVISQPIELQAVERGPGSVNQRVDLWKRMLWEDRLYFSAERTPKLIEMNKNVKKSKVASSLVPKHSKWKHVFDAASYGAGSELYSELTQTVTHSYLNQRRIKQESTVVSV